MSLFLRQLEARCSDAGRDRFEQLLTCHPQGRARWARGRKESLAPAGLRGVQFDMWYIYGILWNMLYVSYIYNIVIISSCIYIYVIIYIYIIYIFIWVILVRMALILNTPQKPKARVGCCSSTNGRLWHRQFGCRAGSSGLNWIPFANRSWQGTGSWVEKVSVIYTLGGSWPCLPDSRLIYIYIYTCIYICIYIYTCTYMYIHMSWCGWKTPLDIAANAKSKAQLRTFFATSTSSTSFKGVAMQQSQTEGRMPAM